MTKATSKMLALLLSFAMVFSFIGWLSVSEVSADSNDVLVDARIPDVYAGWAVDGNEVGGHLEGAVNFAAQWVDESVYPTNQTRYLTREEGLTMALADSGITADKSVTVYDTNGKDAQVVADFFKSKGITNVTTVTTYDIL